MNQGVVLRGRQRQLKDITYEVRHYRAAATSLRLQVGHIGHRHVVGKLKRIIPSEIAIHRASTEAARIVLMNVAVNRCRSPKKLSTLQVQTPIVIQVVNIELESPLLDFQDVLFRNVIAFFGYHLKRSPDPI